MPATLVVARGPWLFLLGPAGSPPAAWKARSRAGRPARPAADPSPDLEPALGDPGREAGTALETWGASAAQRLALTLNRPFHVADPRSWAPAASRLPPWEPGERRSYLLALARAELEAALRSPEEVVISLAREEARFERAVEREDRAAEAFVSPPATVLAEQARAWAHVREALHEHQEGLRSRLDKEARTLLPNLSAVVGSRVAARLLAAAGSLAVLGRISSSRLQLLGARRRPSPDRGPRYGLLYRAECLQDVPPERRAAFARSVAALAVIAARADGSTHADLAPQLLARRELRAKALRRTAR